MLFSTSLVALTLSPRVLRIQNTKVRQTDDYGYTGTDNVKRHSTICEMTFRTAILAMRMNRKRIVVVLESELYIYDISNLQMLKTEKTSPNPNGTSREMALQSFANKYSNMRPLSIVREQLPCVSATHQSRTRYLPAAFARAAQDGSYRTYEWRGPYIRCNKDGGSQRHRGTQLSAILHCAE